MELTSSSYKTYLGKNREPGPSGSGDSDHFKTFLSAVRSGRREDLGADIEEGHLSSALCHLGNIAYRVRRTIQFDRSTEKIMSDEEACSLLTRDYQKPFVVPEQV